MEDMINDALDNVVLTNGTCNKMVMVWTNTGKRLLYVLYRHYQTTKHDYIAAYEIMYC